MRPALPHLNWNERQLAEWTTALGESPESALERLRVAGLLVQFSPTDDNLASAVASIYGVAQLRVMLKSRALKLSGKKNELVARLLVADSQGITREIDNLGLFHCSCEGTKLAAVFEARKEEAKRNAIDAIEARDYESAILQYQGIENDLGFPKWEFERAPSPAFIELVMTVNPRILAGCSDEVLAKLRCAMALQCIAGRHAPRDLLAGLNTGIRLDAETAARMIFFLARHTEDTRQWRELDIKFVTHFAAVGSCPTCTTLNGKKWSIDEAPELPSAECSNDDLGCRCLYQPVIDNP
ncbi:MAG TPA: SAP domain-containing protein [Candidatus Sulfotelmatobacter sp.]|nr:SAP domain-containing protein [Candidatus Sulfotelmatobacter sp.]